MGTAAPPPGVGIGEAHQAEVIRLSLQKEEMVVLISDGLESEETQSQIADFTGQTPRPWPPLWWRRPRPARQTTGRRLQSACAPVVAYNIAYFVRKVCRNTRYWINSLGETTKCVTHGRKTSLPRPLEADFAGMGVLNQAEPDACFRNCIRLFALHEAGPEYAGPASCDWIWMFANGRLSAPAVPCAPFRRSHR